MINAAEEAVLILVDALRSKSWCYMPQFLDIATVAALRADMVEHSEQFSFAGVGRAEQRQQSTIRSDQTLWLSGETPAQQDFLASMEILRSTLNRHLYLGLADYEAHYSHYAQGAFYRRHLDTFQNADRSADQSFNRQARRDNDKAPLRVLSTVCYLNVDWQADDGGELVLWEGGDHEDKEVARIIPNAGAAIFFLSAQLPHEVKPALADRYSIAGWFRATANSSSNDAPFPGGNK